MIFDQIDAALSIWDRIRKWWHTRKNPPAELISARFVRLFETHGVHRNQIPRFFGHDLTLKDMHDDAGLLLKLNENLLQDACECFAVRREWLDGAELQIHPLHDFYKHPEEFSLFLDNLLTCTPQGQMRGVLIAPKEARRNDEALLIFQETIGAVGDKPIHRYHLCHGWSFSYWKSRAYLTACVAIAWEKNVYVHGIHMSKQEIEQLSQGNLLLGWQGEGIWELGHKSWYPEDMALRPEVFLEKIDPEENNFGLRSGLELWLSLEKQGLMKTGFDKGSRQLFEQELTNHYSTRKRN